MKRAGIYIRVSSERQGNKISPQAQQDDCREYCESRGYRVLDIYQDIEKYRVGTRLVEPSGTRADRPALKRLLEDAYNGRIDLIIAWREDRLYRSYRPMLNVLDCLEKTKIDIELVKETFDKRIAPVKAWAAKMELDAKHDRFVMGVANRLKAGKNWNTRPPYGYKREGDYLVEDPSEAVWVRKLFEWYAEGESIQVIRERLIDAGARQRLGRAKRPWLVSNLYKMLRYEPYWSGKQIVKWGKEEYKITIPTLVSKEVSQACTSRRAKYKQYPAGNAKHFALAAGLAYCAACNTRMSIVTTTNGHTRKDGTLKRYAMYSCVTRYKSGINSGCAGRTSMKKADAQIWEKVWQLISMPGLFEEALEALIEEQQEKGVVAETECQRLQKDLDEILLERQSVIAWARKKIISEEDLETQLMSLTLEQGALERQLSETQLLLDNRSDQLIDLAKMFREQVQAGIEAINAEPETREHSKLQTEFKQKVVDSIVERVDVLEDKTVKVHFVFDFSKLLEPDATVYINDQLTSSWIRSTHPTGPQ